MSYETSRKDFVKTLSSFVGLPLLLTNGRLDEETYQEHGQEDIKSKIGPYFNDVVAYSTTPDGSIDLLKMQELEGRYSHVHGNRFCDVLEGPCACGAWH